ncbi:Peroxin/Dysferlin domain-containing protein [Powellomyces hirtus]|nr:Peroxin/Dysferlin domain-containing protein [Powellomyces hirtus]
MTLFSSHRYTPGDGGGGRSVIHNLVNKVLINTAREHEKIPASAPPLNLLTTTPWNVSRIVTRLGPVVRIYETTQNLITWKDPIKTILLMAVWVSLCYYPTMLCITPHLSIIIIILRNHERKDQFMRKREMEASIAVATGWTSSIAVGSEEYLRNMQFMQNMMSMYCDAHDYAVSRLKALDWSHPPTTSRILQYVFASIPATWLVYFAVPFNYILLVGGVLFFVHKTTNIKAPQILQFPLALVPALGRRLSAAVDALRGLDGLASPDMPVGGRVAQREMALPKPVPVTIALYENQRWWAGWIPHLLSSERTPWSDAQGTVSFPAPQDYEVPLDWVWVDDWKIDGEWFDTDAEGWVYSDHKWMSPSPQAGLVSLTRRRRWIRSMMQVPRVGSGRMAS